jgi:hypothetical protein
VEASLVGTAVLALAVVVEFVHYRRQEARLRATVESPAVVETA